MPRISPLSAHEVSPTVQESFEQHTAQYQARITNMKATMGKALPVFKVYMQWYVLYDELKKVTGERTAYLFAHAVSSASNCPLCTTFFRKIMIDNGEQPDTLILSEKEQLLLQFGSAMAANRGEVSNEIYEPLAKMFTEEEIIVLVGFAGQMIATNVFNNVLQVQIDEYLAPYFSLQ